MLFNRTIPRDLHPGAWWVWSIAMASTAMRTTNPLLLSLIIAVVAFVVSARRTDAPWAEGFRAYVVLGLIVIGVRVFFRMLLDGQHGEHVLFTLPEVPLPEAAAGIRLGGPVSAEGILAAFYDGLRLATMLLCLGCANALANPKRLLKSVPSALYEIGTTITVALSVAPQLIESGKRVMAARALRGNTAKRTRWLRQVVVPVMTDSLDRSLALAAAMESRGYGRTGSTPRGTRRLNAALMLVGLGAAMVGVYATLDATAPRWLGTPTLCFGLAVCAAAIFISGSLVKRTRYRPDRWTLQEWGVCAVGLGVAVAMHRLSATEPLALNPSVYPLSWPVLPALGAAAVLGGALAVAVSPPALTAPAAPTSANSAAAENASPTPTVALAVHDPAALRRMPSR